MKLNIICVADSSHPCFGALVELAEDIGRVTVTSPPEPREKRRKKSVSGWTPEKRHKQKLTQLQLVAGGLKKASPEKVAAAIETLRLNGASH